MRVLQMREQLLFAPRWFAWLKDRLAIEQKQVQPIQESVECRTNGEVARVIAVYVLPPVWRVKPDEIETADVLVGLRIASVGTVEAGVEQVSRAAFDAEFAAHVGAGTAPRHWVQRALCTEVAQQILEEFAAAIAGIPRVPIGASICLVIKARRSSRRCPSVGPRPRRCCRSEPSARAPRNERCISRRAF